MHTFPRVGHRRRGAVVAAVALISGALLASCGGGEPTATTETGTSPGDGEPAMTVVDTTVVATVAPPVTSVVDTEVTDTSEPPEPTPSEVAGSPAGVKGSFDAPVPAGEIADLGEGWRLQVLEVVPDWGFQDYLEPSPGMTFTRVRVLIGYFGVEDPVGQLFVQAVGPEKTEVIDLGGPTQHILFAGAVLARDLVFEMPASDPTGLDLYVENTVGDTVVLDVAPAAAAPMAGLVGPQPGARSTELRETAPLPLGSVTDIGEGWSVSVTGIARDVTDEVLASEYLPSDVPAGYRYVGVPLTFTYSGSEPANSYAVAFTAMKALPTGSNLAYPSVTCNLTDSRDFAGNPMDVLSGGTVSGTMCFAVPEGSNVADLELLGGWFVAFYPYPGEPAPQMAFLAVR